MKGHLVVIEWDGMKAPNPFYHRVNRLAGKVRGDKSIGPIARRSIETAVIMQEGAIWAADETLARTIALLAQKYGATNVSIGQVFGMDAVIADDQDIEALARVERVCGRRGRPPEGEPTTWNIACYAESKVFSEIEGNEPLNCENCGSMLIKSFSGNMAYISYPHSITNGNLFEHWHYGRFSLKSAYFPVFYAPSIGEIIESPGPEYQQISDPAKGLRISNIHDDEQRETVERMNKSDLRYLDNLIHESHLVTYAMSVLDGIFVGQYKMREEDVTKNRIAAIAQVIQDHGAYNFHLVRPDDQLDLFDAAAVRGVEFISKVFEHIKRDSDLLEESGLTIKN
jgi:hypothetical protein